MGRVSGKVALITGGASGIGAACARMLAEEGARVVVTDIDDPAGEALAEELGDAARYTHLDVREESDWHAAVKLAQDAFGGLNVLVNNAGAPDKFIIEETTLDDWRGMMAINNDGVFLGCKAAIAGMKETGGSIINMSSIHGIQAAPYAAAYSAAKGAVRLLTKSVALYCAENGYRIRCNSVHPGYVLTPLLEDAFSRAENPNEMRDMIHARHPIGRIGTPEDVAYGVLYLASDESAFVTGSELVIDGGYLL